MGLGRRVGKARGRCAWAVPDDPRPAVTKYCLSRRSFSRTSLICSIVRSRVLLSAIFLTPPRDASGNAVAGAGAHPASTSCSTSAPATPPDNHSRRVRTGGWGGDGARGCRGVEAEDDALVLGGGAAGLAAGIDIAVADDHIGAYVRALDEVC